jgi:hypothetical protein
MLYSSDRSPQRPDMKLKVAEELKQFSLNTYRSVFLVHWIGYGLLAFWVFDICFLIFPSRVTDPNWFFACLERIVESAPILLVGFVLAFFGERKPRLEWEFRVLKFLSWGTILLCSLFILLIPSTILVGVQVAQSNQASTSRTLQSQGSQIQALQANVENANSPAEVRVAADLLGLSEKNSANISIQQDLPTVKADILRRLKIQDNFLRNRERDKLTGRNLSVLKRSVKIILGALMATGLLFLICRSTAWARHLDV